MKRFARGCTRILVPALASALLTLCLFYLYKGLPLLTEDLKKAQIRSVTVTQQGETAQLTDPEDLRLAFNLCGTLTFRFGKAEQSAPETLYHITFADGSVREVGAAAQTVFKDGKAYRGDEDVCSMFINLTRGVFFSDTAAEGETLPPDP